MKCKNCPALLEDCGEYTEYCCGLGEEEIEFNDNSIGCMRKSKEKIKRDLKTQREINEPEIIKQMGDMADFLSKGI